MPAGQDRAGLSHLLVGGVENRRHSLLRQLLGELGDRQGQQRASAHREHVVEGVRRCDRPEVTRVIDKRWEKVEREDERRAVVEPVDGSVVGRGEPDEQILRLCGDEPGEQLLEAGGGVLGRAAARGHELGELHGHAWMVGTVPKRELSLQRRGASRSPGPDPFGVRP
jgi:hypothetical protein